MDYAQLCLPQASIGMSPHEVLYGTAPVLHFDWSPHADKDRTASTQLNRDKAQRLACRMDEAIGIARGNLEQAQARMKRSQDASRRDVD